jgi:hypothetical protein
MSDTITISRSEVERLSRISMEAHGVLGMFDAVIEDADSYTSDQLLRVICVAHTRLENACRQYDSEVDNG